MGQTVGNITGNNKWSFCFYDKLGMLTLDLLNGLHRGNFMELPCYY